MKIATFNINGIKARINALTDWIDQSDPDIILLQEIKSRDEAFPKDYYVRLYNSDEHGLVWITCNKLSDLRGNDITKFPVNVPLPTPK